jgi:hypothetical protein
MKDSKSTIIIAFVFVLVVFITFYRIYRDNQLLSDYEIGKAVLVEVQNKGGVHGSASGTFKYTYGNKKYTFTESQSFSFLNLGDTVKIKYSVKDPSVAKVIDKYFMKKHNNLE